MDQRQPNSRHCFVCGLENSFGLKLRFDEISPGKVSSECTLGEEYQGYPGVVHGGIVAAILDEIAGRSQMGGDPPRFLVTAKLDIRYRKNVPLGEPLHLIGMAGSSKRRTATASSAIYDREGTLLAEAEALLVEIPDDVIQELDREALGWRVYDE